MDGQIFLNGPTPDALLAHLEQVISREVNHAVRTIKTEELMEKYISVSEVQAMFKPRLARQTVYNWIDSGYLNRHFISNRVYFKYSEVTEAIKSLERFKKPY